MPLGQWDTHLRKINFNLYLTRVKNDKDEFYKRRDISKPGMVMHAFNPSRKQRQMNLSEFKASVVHMVNSRPVRATDCDPVSKRKFLGEEIFPNVFFYHHHDSDTKII